MLLCNSLGTDLSMWDAQVGQWARSRHVVRFDQRGHGASDAPEGPYTYERLGRDAIAVLDAVGAESADVCGLSLGGAIALWIAAHVTDRVRRLVLADTAARIGHEEAWLDRAAIVRSGGIGSVADLVMHRFFSTAFRQAAPPAVERFRGILETTDPEGYAASCEALAHGDLREAARHVDTVTLLIVGSADEATPPASAKDLHRRLPNSRLVQLEGAGHLANIEQAEAFTLAVEVFLSEASASQGPS